MLLYLENIKRVIWLLPNSLPGPLSFEKGGGRGETHGLVEMHGLVETHGRASLRASLVYKGGVIIIHNTTDQFEFGPGDTLRKHLLELF